MKKLFFFSVSLICGLMLFVSCSGQKMPCDPLHAPMTVTISILGKDDETILPEYNVGIFEGNTAFEALKYAAKENNITIDYSGFDSTAYVKGINNLYEFDYGSSSGWIYAINDPDNCPTVSSGVYKLQNKDHIRWMYVTNML